MNIISQPDRFLINFLMGKPLLHGIDNNKYLLDWYVSLEIGNENISRFRAKKFLEKTAEKLVSEMGFSDVPKQNLISMFEPLDRLFVSALSIGRGVKIREHLSHTIRNYLFSHYLLQKLNCNDIEKSEKILGIASIFHDLAYPIEKFKKAASGLSDAFFKDYLDTQGRMEVEIVETDNLLSVLDFVGNIELPAYKYLYRWVVAPAIAGVGLFDSNHNISSTSLFIRSTLKKWGDYKTFWEDKKNDLADICLAITFHDRKMNPLTLPETVNLSKASKALRIADELQEWGRTGKEKSYVSEVFIDEHPPPDSILSIAITLKNVDKDNCCNPARFMADKIAGLLPVISSGEKLSLKLNFPNNSKIPNLENVLDEYKFNVENKFLNDPKYMTTDEVKEKIKSTYSLGDSITADFSNNHLVLR